MHFRRIALEGANLTGKERDGTTLVNLQVAWATHAVIVARLRGPPVVKISEPADGTRPPVPP